MRFFLQRYLRRPLLIWKDWQSGVKLSLSSNAIGSRFEGKNKVYSRAVVGSELGRGTYIGPDSQLNKSRIGRYCSIGPEVRVLGGKHPLTDRLSAHPCFYSTKKQAGFTYVDEQCYDEFSYCDERRRLYVEVGCDVWIGARAVIMGGVKIGHGAVIAAGSVVTKDVEAYSIVGGVPARHIKYRFCKERRVALLSDPWWDQDEAWIMSNIEMFRENIS